MRNNMTPVRIEGTFYAHTRLGKQRHDTLINTGIASTVLDLPSPVLLGHIIFCGSTSFEFEQHHASGEPGTPALLFLITDPEGVALDIVAFDCQTGRLVTWLGEAWALGQDQVFAPRLSGPDALAVWRSPLTWLQHGRWGLVLISPYRAAYCLDGAGALLAEDVDHGRQLRRILTRPAPRILVPRPCSRVA